MFADGDGWIASDDDIGSAIVRIEVIADIGAEVGADGALIVSGEP